MWRALSVWLVFCSMVRAQAWSERFALPFDDHRLLVWHGGTERILTLTLDDTRPRTAGFDGRMWVPFERTATPYHASAGVAYDALRNQVVLVNAGLYGNQTWLWSGRAWHKTAASQTLQRPSPVLADCPAIGRVVEFGGLHQAETWLWDGAGWQPWRGPMPPGRVGHTLATVGNRVVMFAGVDASGGLLD